MSTIAVNAPIALKPPSTGGSTPVIQAASSDAMNTMALATSSCVPGWASAFALRIASSIAGWPQKPRFIAVGRKPGRTALTLMASAPAA